MSTTAKICLYLLTSLLLVPSGCRSPKRAQWYPFCARVHRPLIFHRQPEFDRAVEIFQQALRQERNNCEDCVDGFFQSALMVSEVAAMHQASGCQNRCRAVEIHKAALAKLVSAGQQFGRFAPDKGLAINTAQGQVTIPIQYYGFPGRKNGFKYLIPVGTYRSKDLNSKYQYAGHGLPVVAVDHNEQPSPFRRKHGSAAATVVLKKAPLNDGTNMASYSLELHDALRRTTTEVADLSVPIARDISAPLAYVLSNADKKYLQQFFQPGSSSDETGLFMVEPFQPGKIPVVFVHGLLSDPMTWVNMANEIRARPQLLEKYQIWGYEYPTGEPFLKSAATLRRMLNELQAYYDPGHTDPGMQKILLVGHSMGGLISKLQVSSSENRLWASVSNRSFSDIVAVPQTREQLTEAFFFTPNPNVSRVVFIGTPHQGSPFATRPIGLLGSKLVDEPPESKEMHARLTADNPSAFSKEFTKRLPTSVDILRPDSCLLQATNRLPLNPSVKFHSVIGEGFYMLGEGDSDSVVPVTSASFPQAETEVFLHSKHTKINKSRQCVDEVICIMWEHFRN